MRALGWRQRSQGACGHPPGCGPTQRSEGRETHWRTPLLEQLDKLGAVQRLHHTLVVAARAFPPAAAPTARRTLVHGCREPGGCLPQPGRALEVLWAQRRAGHRCQVCKNLVVSVRPLHLWGCAKPTRVGVSAAGD
eukprot:7377666-Prymnesium_polylepis.1